LYAVECKGPRRNLSAYESLVRPVLFSLSADRAHELGKLAFRSSMPWNLLARSARIEFPQLRTRLAGIELASPIGLAAGFDKSADLVSGLARLGFGYLTVGSITREPRIGNPRPWLGRIPQDMAIVNSMGLPNAGADESIGRLQRLQGIGLPLVVSVAGFGTDDILHVAGRVQPYATAVEIGLICPNTSPEEKLEELDLFARLLEGLSATRDKPVFVKLPGYTSSEEREHVLQMVSLCIEHRIEAVCVSAGQRLKTAAIGTGEGSLTGRPTFTTSVEHVGEVATFAAGRFAVIGAGGVFSGSDAFAMLKAGATTVELYSAFIYRGWNVAGAMKRELVDELRGAGANSVDALGHQPGSSIALKK